MSRQRVALFTEVLDFDGSYSDLLWRAADSRSRELDADLVVLVGRRIDRQDPASGAHNLVYRLALGGRWSGLVVAHIVYQHADDRDRHPLRRAIGDLPAAVTSVPFGDLPVVGFENEQGMAELMDHLLRVHGRRRVVFVTGPEGIEDSRIRRQVWERSMAAAGLPHGDEWVVPGHFNPIYCPEVAAQTARKVLELRADAVVTSSDLVAEVLLRDLPGWGLAVPSDVLVTGFDDIPMAAELDPPLTTVLQPVREQFRTAVDLVLHPGRGGPPAPAQGRLVVRSSCGCLPEEPGGSPEWRSRTVAAWEVARVLRTKVAALNQFAGRIETLGSTGDLAALLDECLPLLGIVTYSLSLASTLEGVLSPWSGGEPWDSGVPAHLRWAAGSPGLPAGSPVVFPAGDLAPASWWNREYRTTSIVLPLAVGTTFYGVAVMEVGPEGNLMCRAVQELVSSFLDREARLKDEVRKALEARLLSQLEAEKNRTLGLMVAGFSHDLATPFSVGRDSTELLVRGFAETAGAYRAGVLSKMALEKFFTDGTLLAGMLEANWTRAGDLVERFKRVGTEVPRDDLRTAGLAEFLDDLMVSLRPLWRSRPVRVLLEAEPGVQVQTRLSALVDVVTNLLQNALVHGFPDGASGVIRVRSRGLGDRCRLEVEDDGAGIAPELAPRIFDPYVTTKEGAGGTGLGLAVVRQRTQAFLGGAVWYEPGPSGGSRFVVEFPRILAE